MEEGSPIQAERCEVSIVGGCNLSCRACQVLAPLAGAAAVRPEVVHEDLSLLARHYRAERVELRGGEPLLHPALPEVAAAVRSSGVAPRIRVVTNGLHLHRMEERFWAAVDEVFVSAFPDVRLGAGELAACVERAQAHGVELSLRRFDHFRESYAGQSTANDELVRRIFATCQFAHVRRCHSVRDGFFAKCRQCHAIAESAGTTRDGVRIHAGDSLGEELRAHLADRYPMRSCRRCLGSAGKRFPHREVEARTWRSVHETCVDHVLDEAHLARLESDPLAPDGCLAAESVLAGPFTAAPRA